MPVSIVVGGQYGSEGKGKVAHYLADKMDASFAVRCGGPNSGHTVIDKQGKARIFQQLPTAAILPKVKLAICAGSYIDLDILHREINESNIDADRLFIDPDAVIITPELKEREINNGLMSRIGSTGSGTGAAVAARINREEALLFAKDIPELKLFVSAVPTILRSALSNEERVIIEGTQGFGLSPLHAKHFPFVTSRDTTAAAFLSETGLSPLDVDDVVLTIRAFPIRVAGCSGPLPEEIDWEAVTRDGGHHDLIQEKTTVTKQIRRVARFDPEIVRRAISINKPTRIVLNHLDYIHLSEEPLFSSKIGHFVKFVEKSTGSGISFFGFGPDMVSENKRDLVSIGVVNG